MAFIKNHPYLFCQNVPINPTIYQQSYLRQKLRQTRSFFQKDKIGPLNFKSDFDTDQVQASWKLYIITLIIRIILAFIML